MPTASPELPRLFGLNEETTALYTQGLQAASGADLEGAALAFEQLTRLQPQQPVFAFHLLGFLLELGRTAEAVTLFESFQQRDELAKRCSELHPMLGRSSGPPPANLFRCLTEGDTRLDRHPDHWSLVKLRGGSIHYSASLPLDGGVVVEGLIGKRTGDDECCQIEFDDGRGREVATFNGKTVVLSSSSHAGRVSLERRLRAFRLVVHRGVSRLWLDGLLALRSDTLLPSRQPGFRFGLIQSSEALDTNYLWSTVRIGVGLAAGLEADDLAPVPRPEPWLANLALLAQHGGRAQEALDLASAALSGRPPADVVDSCASLAEWALDAVRPGDALLQRVLAQLKTRGAGERAARLEAVVEQRRGGVAVACRDLSVYFAKTPHKVTRPLELIRRLARPREYFEKNYRWAVKDVSFEMRYGDVLGIVGNNGAGKSTLLRAIAGILDYEGALAVYGTPRLLVMGLGVQEDLTGRENVLLGCLYLGMRRSVITGQVDSVLDFAELSEFQDLPYRYYSDGMKARLLFSIATSLEPDILLLDELLGAGDIRFRNKAMARMENLIERSKAMIVVTHNLAFVRERASHALYLDRGRARFLGDPNRAVDMYLEDNRIQKPSPAAADSYIFQEI